MNGNNSTDRERIDFASENEIPAAREIWQTCFGDTPEYAGFLFERLLRPDRILFYRDERARPVAMLCFQPLELVSPSACAKGLYLFGVATMPDRRKRGCGSALMEKVEAIAIERKIDATVLVPGSPDLFRFYEKRGYGTAFDAKKVVLAASEISEPRPGVTLRPGLPADLAAWRNDFYSDRDLFVRWNGDYLRFIDLEARALGGGVHVVHVPDRAGYVVCYPHKDALIVKEFAVPPHRAGDALAALHRLYRASEYRIHLPADAETTGSIEPRPFAMLKWLDREASTFFPSGKGKASYVAHVLDGPTLGTPIQDVR